MTRPTRRVLAIGVHAAALCIAAACAGGARPGAAPGAASAAAAAPARRAAPADARFAQHMIHHHAQALAMTALVPARTTRADVRLLSERLEVSQRDEIAQMASWLRDRGETVPEEAAHAARHAAPGHAAERAAHHGTAHEGAHGAGHGSAATVAAGMQMPGMLTEAELGELAAATGAQFEQLFLQRMIRHHEGAITMVAELLASPGAGQDPELFGLASDVDAGQRAEIARMRGLQRASAPPAGR
jgi:uncharacterized protein (DUF305 family)